MRGFGIVELCIGFEVLACVLVILTGRIRVFIKVNVFELFEIR